MHGKTGTVWFTATPTIDNSGHAVRLSDLTMTHRTNSRLWPAVAGPVNTELPKTLGATYDYDFSWLVRDAKAKINQAIANPKNTANVKVSISNDDLHLGRSAILQQNFVVEGLFSADATATVMGNPSE